MKKEHVRAITCAAIDAGGDESVATVLQALEAVQKLGYSQCEAGILIQKHQSRAYPINELTLAEAMFGTAIQLAEELNAAFAANPKLPGDEDEFDHLVATHDLSTVQESYRVTGIRGVLRHVSGAMFSLTMDARFDPDISAYIIPERARRTGR